MSMISRAVAFLQAGMVRQRATAYDRFNATHRLTKSVPNPAATMTDPRQPLKWWDFIGHEHGRKYSGAALRDLRAERGVGSVRRIKSVSPK